MERCTLPEIEDWQLTPEGAVIHPAERTAVIADLHLGYEWARGASGDCVPAHSLDEALARLARVLERAPMEKLIVAGDLVESSRPCVSTTQDILMLKGWLKERDVDLVVLEGNHDRPRFPGASPPRGRARRLSATCTVASWTIGHGDRRLRARRTISGHHHPVFRCGGTAAPCFLVGPGRVVLPSFSCNAAGLDVLTAALPEQWRAVPFRCIASTGCELLDFGPLHALRARRHIVP